MEKQNHNINDLFAAARTSEVKISLDDVRTNLSNNTAKVSLINWNLVFFSITGILIICALFFLPINGENTELAIANSDQDEITTLVALPTTKAAAKTETEETGTDIPTETAINQGQKTSPEKHDIPEPIKTSTIEQKRFDLIHINPIVFDGNFDNNLFKEEVIVNVPFELLKKDFFEVPELELHTLQDKLLEGDKGEIHYMETLVNKETISLKSYKKGGKKHLKLDRYNERFEIIRTIDLSNILQENKKSLANVKMFNNQLVLVTSEISKKEKSRVYTAHSIDFNTMENRGSTTIGKFPISKTKKGINVQTSSNGEYLLVNLKPESTKNQKKKAQKGVRETINFQVYDKDLKPFYTINKNGFLDYGTAIDDLGRIYVWKTQPKFFTTSRAIPAVKNGNVLYQFGANSVDSLILKEDSFLKTISRSTVIANRSDKKDVVDSISTIKAPFISYNHRLIEIKGLELTLSPEGNPILYGYLKNMRGLQQLTFRTDSLSPYHYSVLDFQTIQELENEKARKEGNPDVVLKVDEVFFDEESNFYVLSSSYKRNYLPLMKHDNKTQNIDFSEHIPVPYYPSLDIYVHKFDQGGMPVMNTKIVSSAISRKEEASNYSYLFNDHNFSVVYLDHTVVQETDPKLDFNTKKEKTKEELTVAAARENGDIIRFNTTSNYDINLEDYKPVKYFRNKGQTLVLLKAGNHYKISKLSYRNKLKKAKEK